MAQTPWFTTELRRTGMLAGSVQEARGLTDAEMNELFVEAAAL